jgi:hypothetical protein
MRQFGIAGTVASGLLISAHFLRSGQYLFVVAGLLFPLLLRVKKPWATRTVQLLLGLAAAEWIYTLQILAVQRIETGQPWLRLAIILGAVALFTVGSAIAIGLKSRIKEN